MNDDRDLYSGMMRLHILHHAERAKIFGAGMSEEQRTKPGGGCGRITANSSVTA
jgi:hypothetical protein